MGFLSGVTNFLGGLFGGGDDERKRQQQQQAAARSSVVQPQLKVVQPNQTQNLSVSSPPPNGVDLSQTLNKVNPTPANVPVNGNSPSPAQLRSAQFLKDSGGRVDPNYVSHQPNLGDIALEAVKGIGHTIIDPAVSNYQALQKAEAQHRATAAPGVVGNLVATAKDTSSFVKAIGKTGVEYAGYAAPEIKGLKAAAEAPTLVKAGTALLAHGATSAPLSVAGSLAGGERDPTRIAENAALATLGAGTGGLRKVAPTNEIAPGVRSTPNVPTDLTEHNLTIARAPIPGPMLDSTNSRMAASDTILGQPSVPVTVPGRNITDIGAPTASANPALLQKARDVAIAKAAGTENIVPATINPSTVPIEALVKQIENPTGSSDTELLKSMNDLITHPEAPQAMKDWAISERDKLVAPPGPATAPLPEASAPVPIEALQAPPSVPNGVELPGGGEPISNPARYPGDKEATSLPISEQIPLVSSPGRPSVVTSNARQQLIQGLEGARTQSLSDSQALTAARTERAGKASGMAAGLEGQAATDARRAAFAGEMGHRGEYTGVGGDNAASVFDALRLEAQKNPDLVNKPYALDNVEEALSRAVKGESLDGKVTGAPTDAQINLLKQYFGEDVAGAVKDAVVSSRNIKDQLFSAAGEVAAIPKSIMASFDLSATLRQGGVLSSRFPKEAASAAIDQLKYFASKDTYDAAMKVIEDDPYFETANKSGLAMTGVSSLDKPEEQFVGKVIGKVPGIAGSERAYAGFLTKMRFDVFKNIVNTYADKGVTLSGKELEDVSKFINTASGRGDLGKFFENHSKTLTTALFSPRLWKSRLDMLNPVYYARLSGPARKYALQSAATFAGVATTVLGLASLAGANVESDPRSSDFGKIKIGNTRYDILGGFQQNLVFAYRELTGESKSSTTGNVTKFAKGVQDIGDPNAIPPSTSPYAGNRLTKAGDLVSNKLNPLLSAAGHFISGKGIGSTPLNPIAELANLVVPLSVSGAVAAANDQGNLSLSDIPGSAKTLAKGALINSPDTIGISSQTYGEIPTKYQPQNLAKAPQKIPDAVQKVIDTRAEAARVADFKARNIPENQQGVEQRFQNGEFDKAIEGTKHLESVAAKKGELSKIDKAKFNTDIARYTTMRDKKISYEDFAQYSRTSLADWRNLGDPESDTYNPNLYQKLFAIDQTMAAGKASGNSKDPTADKYSAKVAKKGGGGSKSVTSNTIGSPPSIGRVSLGNLAPTKVSSIKIPTIQEVKAGELIKKRAISVGKR